MESKIQYRSPFGELEQIPLGREDKHFILVEIHLKLIHHFQRIVVRILQRLPHRSQPLVQTRFTLDTFISPVSSQSVFRDLVHAAGTYLHFHPFPFRAHHSDVQRLVTIAFRDREPVAQTLRVRLVHIRNNRINLPAFLLLLSRVRLRIEDDTDGEQVINPLKRRFLLLNLVPYRMNRLGTPLDVELQSCFRHLPLDRFDKSSDILVAGRLRLVQLILDKIVRFLLRIFERQIFQFRFQLIQSQLVRQRSIQICSFVRHFDPVPLIARIFDFAHHVHAVRNHYQDYTHILRKRKQQITEVFRLDSRTLRIQLVRFHQSLDDTCYVIPIFGVHLVDRQYMPLHDFVQHDTDQARTFHTDFLGNDHCRL